MTQRDETGWTDKSLSVPKQYRKTCSKPELGYQTKEHRRHEQDLATGISFPLGQRRNPLLGGLALLRYCNIIFYKMSSGSVYTLDIYALITDSQIQIEQSVNRYSYTLKLPAVLNSSSKPLLL